MPARGTPADGSLRGGVRLLCGPHGSGRAARIDSLMRAHWGRAVLLVPTRQCAQRRLEQIILESDIPGAWGRPVLTFGDFVVELLRAQGKTPVLLGDFERRLLLEGALARVRGKPALAALGAAAQTRGFASQMLRVITDLKQAAVDPDRFSAYAKKSRGFLDPVVADVYEAYQNALMDEQAYDLPGMFWEAAVVAEAGKPRRTENLEALLLDGFDDFTPSEFNLLAALRPHVRLLALGLNCDTTPNRSDLYSAPLRTARRIETEFDAAIENFRAPQPETYTQYAAGAIFWRDQPVAPPKSLRQNLEIVPCADAVQEIEFIGRRIKRLLLDGAAPADIAVVYASLETVAPIIRPVLAEFGIPARVLEPPRLLESSVGAFALTLVEALDEWKRETVVDVLVSPWFMPGRPHTEAIPALARAAAIIGGRTEWVRRLDSLATRMDNGGRDAPGMPGARQALDALRDSLKRLLDCHDMLPAKATAADFIDALKRLLEHLDVAGAIGAHTAAPIRDRETAAFAALLRMLGVWRVWSRDTEPASRAAFAAGLRQALQQTQFTLPQPRDAVVVMQAQAARLLEFEHVFYAGVNEGDVPGPPRVSAVYSEHERAELERAGIKLERRYAHIEREMMRFHHVLSAARGQLTISWRTSSQRTTEQDPSPYVKDLLELFDGGNGIQAPMPRAQDFVPPLDHAASWRDVRNAAFAASEDAAAGLRARFPHIELAAKMETARHDSSPFGVYDGMIADKAVFEWLSTAFGVDHVFSVSQLETYAECPFRFYVERVLKLKEAQTPTAEFDALVRGTILHDVLEKFHLQHHMQPVCAIPPEKAEATVLALIDEAFDSQGWRSVNAPPAVVAVEKRYVTRLLMRFLENQRAKETEWKPAHFEASFGRTRAQSQCALSTPHPYTLELKCGPVRFAGRIDRVDLHNGQSEIARIIDYKTSRLPQRKDIDAGRSLQMAVYALALENLLMPGAQCEEARFLSISKNSECNTKRNDDNWGKPEAVCEIILRHLEGLRAGRFAPAPPGGSTACSYCSAKRACRFDTGRIKRKSPADASFEEQS